MMFVYHVLLGMKLQVQLPMIVYCDNKGAVELANNWLVGGRAPHIDIIRTFYKS